MAVNKVFGMIGMARRAGKIKSGEFQTEAAIKDGSAALVIVAADASDNTKKKFRDSCRFYEVPYAEFGDKETLGHAIGMEFRASLAVTDAGFAKGIQKNMA